MPSKQLQGDNRLKRLAELAFHPLDSSNQKLSEIGLAPGMKLFWSEINYTKETGFGKFSLAAYWKRKYRGKADTEGWYILTNLSQIQMKQIQAS